MQKLLHIQNYGAFINLIDFENYILYKSMKKHLKIYVTENKSYGNSNADRCGQS